MTAAEIAEGSRRLEELERRMLLSEETIRELKRWWREKLRDDAHPKVIPFPIWRVPR